jgi:hypothetical protein
MPNLLFFIDEGGFDDFTPLFVELGFTVDFENSQRKAVKLAKKNQYQVLVAEFSHNPVVYIVHCEFLQYHLR